MEYTEAKKFLVNISGWMSKTYYPFGEYVRPNGDSTFSVLRDALGRVLLFDENEQIIGVYPEEVEL